MNNNQKQCKHNRVEWVGYFSMLGDYVCRNCGLTIDPVVYHAMKNQPHVLFYKDRVDELKKYIEELDKDQQKLYHQSVNKT